MTDIAAEHPCRYTLTPARQHRLVALIAAVQFVNIVDFMMVMPLGPDFADALGVPADRVGIIGGSYTLAAAVAGLLLAPVLDRLERRVGLTLTMLGLGVATLLTTQATDLNGLVAARLLAGVFGGASASIALATVADAVPPERRGRAMGWVMAAFSVSAVAGVPLGLELALAFGWQAPFAVIGGLALLMAVVIWLVLPEMREHCEAPPRAAPSLRPLLRSPAAWQGYALAGTAMFAGFLIIPNIATFLVLNHGFPRESIGLLYLVGGAASFFVMQAAGQMVDRLGSFPVSVIGTVVLAVVLIAGFAPAEPVISAYLVFVLFMSGMNMRGVTSQTVTSKIPSPELRAGYLSMQSAMQHVATTLGALVSSLLLITAPDGRLLNMELVAALAVISALAQPLLILSLRRSRHAYERIG